MNTAGNPQDTTPKAGDRVRVTLGDGTVVTGVVRVASESRLALRGASVIPREARPAAGDDWFAPSDEVQRVELIGPPELKTWAFRRHVRGGGWVWSLLAWCPECRKVHTHGGNDGAVPDAGHRVAHCVPGSAFNDTDYVLVDAEPIPDTCEAGHELTPERYRITADGIECLACKRRRQREARKQRQR